MPLRRRRRFNSSGRPHRPITAASLAAAPGLNRLYRAFAGRLRLSRSVTARKREGGREYDDAARDELVQLCLQPGVLIARTAMEHDLNLNVLRGWIARKTEAQVEHERVARTPTVTESVSIEIASTPSAFVPVVWTAASSVTLPPTPSAQVPSMALSLHCVCRTSGSQRAVQISEGRIRRYCTNCNKRRSLYNYENII